MAVGFHEVLSDDITRPGEVKWQRKSDIDVMSATAASDSAASAGEVATTLDGRTFSFNMSPQQMFPIGCFVSLTDDHGSIRLAQVESHRLAPGGQMQATGGCSASWTPTGWTATQHQSSERRLTLEHVCELSVAHQFRVIRESHGNALLFGGRQDGGCFGRGRLKVRARVGSILDEVIVCN